MTRPVFSFDTETFRIRPGLAAPPIVCLQYKVDWGRAEIIHAKDPALVRMLRWALENAILDGHNLAYDTVVICASYLDLLPLVFEAYERDRMTCTAIRHKLHDIACGQFRGIRGSDGKFVKRWGYSLDQCLDRITKGAEGAPKVDKTDPWRVAYGALYNLPIAAWPESALRYAIGDAEAQQTLYFGQEKHFHPAEMADQFRQARAAFWLRLMESWGVRTDASAVAKYTAIVLEEWTEDLAILKARGIVRADGTKDTKAAMSRMISVCQANGIDIPLTGAGKKFAKEKGLTPAQVFSAPDPLPHPSTAPLGRGKTYGKGICLDAESTEATGDEVLEAYSRFSSLSGTLTKVKRLERGTITPIQPRYETLMETGRTSCTQGEDPEPDANGILWEPAAWGSQMQNPPKKKGIRECFVARPGYSICAVDFDGKELRSWAQVCLWSVGRSRMAEVLNAGEDPHTDLAGRILGISREEARAIRKGERGVKELEIFEGLARQSAKIGNFGFMGGMGSQALLAQAWTIYRVKLGLDPKHPEEWTQQKGLEFAKFLKRAWTEEWPESKPYFEWINMQVRQGGGSATISQFLSRRIRGKLPYTVACNSFFQGLAADSAKDCGWELAKAMYLAEKGSPLYGSRLFGFVHDEFLAEIPNASREHRHAAAFEMARVMCATAKKWIPDVVITAKPELMKHWTKKAKTHIAPDGYLDEYEAAPGGM